MRISYWSSYVCSSVLLLVPFEADEGIIAVQRILLDPATGEKRYHAALREAKLTLGLVRHAAMRIGGQPPGDVLRLAEGFEEAVSVSQLSAGKFKVWGEIGREHVRTPVTNAPTVCRLRPKKKK